jgi:hypothetical protein
MSEENILTLKPHAYGKLGLIHCGVTHEGFVAVGGFPRDIADGEELVFDKIGVKASREGSEYTFTKLNE